ncbi:hypothetical protein GCM10023350_19390 [Nocardioides endophyticus]|uniref:Uncharacterized protein n=1 Tax=Nocardioides endophyticus TaxID=1353775 RepID=A0ABP8YQ82_9ACTN
MLSAWTRRGLCGTAVLLFGAGAVTAFVTDNGVGSAALTTAGLAALLLAAIGNHIESFEAAGVKLGVRRFVVAQEALAQEADRTGRKAEAAQLRRQTSEVLDLVRSVSRSYDDLRSTMPAGWERTQRFEEIVREAKAAPALTADVLDEQFSRGTEGDRIFVLGNLQGHPEIVDVSIIDRALTSPRSAFEQYHALMALEAVVDRLTSPEKARFRRKIDRLLGAPLWKPSSDRRKLGAQLVELLAEPETAS